MVSLLSLDQYWNIDRLLRPYSPMKWKDQRMRRSILILLIKIKGLQSLAAIHATWFLVSVVFLHADSQSKENFSALLGFRPLFDIRSPFFIIISLSCRFTSGIFISDIIKIISHFLEFHLNPISMVPCHSYYYYRSKIRRWLRIKRPLPKTFWKLASIFSITLFTSLLWYWIPWCQKRGIPI